MTRISRTGFAFCLLTLVGLVAGPLATTVRSAPPPQPPAPTGTIYYRNGPVYYAVKPDGSGQAANILPNIGSVTAPAPLTPPEANPAYSPSGSNATHDRWWIYAAPTGVYDHWVYPDGSVVDDVPHWDLFAVRSDATRTQLITVQLTDLYGIARVGPYPCWSNDGNDDLQNSFVTTTVKDIRDSFVEQADGTTTVVDVALSQSLRLPITISEIQLGFVPFRPESAEEEADFDAMLLPFLYPAGYLWAREFDGQGVIAPSGNARLRISNDSPLFIEEWTQFPSGSPPLILWDGRDGVPKSILTAQWSPNGQTIAMDDFVTSGAPGVGINIFTQPASGATAPKKVLSASVKGQSSFTYSNPMWSPDNKYLVVKKRQFTGTTLTGAWLTRLSLSDGKTLDLCPIVDAAKPLRWTADN